MSLDAQLQSDFQILAEFPAECVGLVMDLAIDVLADPKNCGFQEKITELQVKSQVPIAQLKNLARGVIFVLRRAVQQGTQDTKLAQELIDYSVPNEVASFIVSKWKECRTRIATAVVNRTMSANQLVDLEWRFGVTASSDSLDQVGNSYLQMRLVFEVGQGQVQEVIMELSLNQFYTFVAELENAKAFISDLSNASV